jgi:hypothetical protein
MFELADNDDIIVVCFPSHTTQSLQPSYRAFFKALKQHYKHEATKWMIHNSGRQIARLQECPLIGRASKRAVYVDTDLSTFIGKAVFPLNCRVIEEHLYSISDRCAEVEMKL